MFAEQHDGLEFLPHPLLQVYNIDARGFSNPVAIISVPPPFHLAHVFLVYCAHDSRRQPLCQWPKPAVFIKGDKVVELVTWDKVRGWLSTLRAVT